MKILNRKTGAFLLRWGLTLLVAAVVLVPLYWVFISSITPKTMLFQIPIDYWPNNPTLENYKEAFTVLKIMEKAGNTLFITISAMILSIGFGLLGAYGFAKFKSRSLSIVYGALLFSILIPGIITARSLYDLLRAVKLLDTYPGLILVYSSIISPFTLLILRNSIDQIPASIEEAAGIDGAGFLQKIFLVTFPLLRPAIATIAIINFITCFNEFFAPLIYSYRIETLSLGITTIPVLGEYNVPWEKISTMGWLMILPIVIFVVIFEKNIMEGILAGGVKQ